MEKKIDSRSEGRREPVSPFLRLILALFVLALIGGTFILYLSWPLMTGKTIVLRTYPVDPFDILRGQYLSIGYEISNIPSIDNAKEGDTVYVSLKEDENETWSYESASLNYPSSGTFIRGKITSLSSWRGGMQIEYGIEQYFFERNAQVPRANQVEIKLDSEGQARVVRLLNNGEPIKIKYD